VQTPKKRGHLCFADKGPCYRGTRGCNTAKQDSELIPSLFPSSQHTSSDNHFCAAGNYSGGKGR